MKKNNNPKSSPKAREELRLLLDSARQPAAPPGHALTRAKPEERAHPAERKAKHKRRPGESE